VKETEGGRQWAKEMGFDPLIFYPKRECGPDDPRPQVQIISPADGSTVTTPEITIRGVAPSWSRRPR